MPRHSVPPFHANINFNAHHAPMGAFFSFTCGHFGSRGGLGLQMGRPANQDLYIGVKDGDRFSACPLRCLPFYEGADKGAQAAVPEVAQQAAAAAASFQVEQADPDADRKRPKVTAYGKAQISRHYGWGTDTWKTADFSFTVFTPFGSIPDPSLASASEMRRALLPAVLAELRVDNRKGRQSKTAFFCIGFHEPGVRILDEGLGVGQSQRVGFALRNHLGVCGEVFETARDAYTATGRPPFVFMRWSPNDGLAERDNPVHLLGSSPGIGIEVPPGKCWSLVLAIGCYLDGVVTTRLEGRYLYTRYFAALEDVLDAALSRRHELAAAARQRDAELEASSLNQDQRFLLAHATRSYYGSTQLLDVGGRPYWIVNEGEYCMINTLDLSVDHVFWELKHNPWVIRNLLDNFVRFYSYHDQCGISFCHDQGIHNQFSPLAHSSYELTNLDGCFSHMTQEQLCNWTLIAASYVAKTGDVDWARSQRHVIDQCLTSMQNRDNPNPAKRNGITGVDSSRCGRGQEITTYDSLDHSLAQTRNNLYIAVKCWATYLGLELLFVRLGDRRRAKAARLTAELAARTVVAQMRPDGWLPAVFEKDNPGYQSKILPAAEGLVYPLYWGTWDARKWAGLARALRRHAATLLATPATGDGANRFADGGIKLSSTSNNSWASKIAIFQHVARRLLNLDEFGARLRKKGPGGWEKSDAAHTKWQTEGASAYWACSDQMVKGVAQGSKYYPRIVTTVLWLDE